MTRVRTVLATMLAAFSLSTGLAQESAAPGLSQKEKPKPAEKTDPLKAAFSGKPLGDVEGPITTQIFAEEAFFDSANNIGIFTGKVIVNDPRFSLQSDKLTVYLGKGEQRGLEKAVAEGNVGVVREQAGENGQPPSRSIGRADTAVYTASDGNVELRGNPRIANGPNSHIATSPDTVMIVNANGQLTTKGPSRTEIRQDPKTDAPKP